VSRPGLPRAVCAVACALAAVLLPAAGTAAAAGGAGPEPRAAVTPPAVVSIPAYAGPGALRARLPVGGRVTYGLAKLPDGGQRVMGDWDGDGAQTPGIFSAGQWQLSDHLVRAGSPDLSATFGQAGDIPVTGDWNGDGLTDIGVVRGNEWILSLSPLPSDGSAPVIWRDLTFGEPGDLPVAGDWNGDGTDGIGAFHDGQWLLADSVDDLAHSTTVSFGAAGDQPVAGDWDGDGADGLGVVRGDTWYLSNSTTTPKADTQAVLGRRPTDAPIVWQVPSSPDAATCPTRRTTVAADSSWVVPSPLLDRVVPAPARSTTRQVRGSLEQSERYLLGAQYDSLWSATRSHAYLSLLSGPGHDELAVRLPAMSALAVAIGLRTGAADPSVVGASPGAATKYVDQLVRSIACEHEAVSPDGWGLGWETPHWAMLAGAAAWLVWDRLTPQTRTDVTAMLVAEADRESLLAVPYWGRPDGSIATPGDTKAEDCAWGASLLSLASSMMPSAPHASLWRASSAELAVAAYSTFPDLSSSTLVNGVPLSARLQGFNAYPDGTVENHQIIHPDYASNIQLLWLGADFARLAGRWVPEAMFHNAGLVYSSLSTHSFQAGATSPVGGVFADPGGTVYMPGSDTIYYPQGDDWGVVRRAFWVSLDAHAMVYSRYLGATGWPATEALAQHEKAQRTLWRTSGADDGRTYSVDPVVAAQEDTYPGREEYAAQNLATAWLALYIGQLGVPSLLHGLLPVPVTTEPAAKAPASVRLGP
jgi:hypothetical protein